MGGTGNGAWSARSAVRGSLVAIIHMVPQNEPGESRKRSVRALLSLVPYLSDQMAFAVLGLFGNHWVLMLNDRLWWRILRT